MMSGLLTCIHRSGALHLVNNMVVVRFQHYRDNTSGIEYQCLSTKLDDLTSSDASLKPAPYAIKLNAILNDP